MSRMKSTLVLLGSLALGTVIVGSVLSTPGCGGGDDEGPTPCNAASDCDDTWGCVDGYCRKACVSTSACPSPIEACTNGYCIPVDNPSCTKDGDCQSPGQCQELTGAQCQGGACVYTSKSPGTPCDDDDKCTTNDRCLDGQCAGTAKLCDDPPANECVDEDRYFRRYSAPGTCRPADGGCDYTVVGLPCPNCTIACLQPCAALECDPPSGSCRTSGYCDPGPPAGCVYETADDGTPCDFAGIQDGTCSNGQCTDRCSEDADCEDGNPCTTDTCDSNGVCRSGHNTEACDDLNPCTSGDICNLGTCQGTQVDAATSCGTCKACNATGQCVDTPADDAACGTIECDGLDTTCRDYTDLTANRCAGFGACKAANLPSVCVDFSNAVDGTACGTGNCAACADGVCGAYPSKCTGNCDTCSGSGTNFNCAADESLCTGNCDTCSGSGTTFNCAANQNACTGNCDTCSGSGTTFNCAANESACTGNCDTCSGSGTTFNCAANESACTGNCDTCSGSGTTFNCGTNDAACTGNCDTCTGSGTTFDCAPNESACTGNCDTCAGSGTAFSCAPNPSLCTGNCAVCNGGGTHYSCAANDSLCCGECGECFGTGTNFNCGANYGLCPSCGGTRPRCDKNPSGCYECGC